MCRITLDFPDDSGAPRRLTFRHPREAVTASSIDEVVPALARIEAATRSGHHAAGFLAYEAAPAFDPAMRVRRGSRLPLLWFGIFDAPADDSAEAGEGAAADAVDDAANDRAADAVDGGRPDWKLDTAAGDHAAAVGAVRRAIAEGRTYQVNLTARYRARGAIDVEGLYEGMRRAQGSGYHALLDMGRFAVASASPELFFRTRGRSIITRPMKGTRRRGRWPEEDAMLAAALRASPKDRAENLMIVDLLRNDLGRVCETGSVEVRALAEAERYRTVWQLTSTIAGRLRTGVGLADVFGAIFPCGSVTGAPKISTMGLIAGLETSPREVYCGAIGWVRPGGDAVFNVPIRTVWVDRESGTAEYGAGGGVVWDSTPEAELDELRAKAAVVTDPWPRFRLLETMALVDGAIRRRHGHLARLGSSAHHLGFPFPAPAVEAALDRASRDHPSGRGRVRLTLDEHGGVEVEVAPLDWWGAPGPDGERTAASGAVLSGPATIALADRPIDSRDPFLYHKTTRRDVYDARLAAAPEGVLDVLLHNERGEVTELCRGNVVVELDGRLVTPPRSAGLLAGRFRAALLAAGAVEEAVVPLSALGRATRIWLVNSVREWVPVRLADAAE